MVHSENLPAALCATRPCYSSTEENHAHENWDALDARPSREVQDIPESKMG